jgi:putative tricarboxylic transport membrane protein
MNGDRWAGGVLVLLAVAVAAEASTFDVAFLTDPVGPKALPWLAASLLLVTGGRIALRPGPAADWPARGPILRMVGAVATLLAYALLLATLGFFGATTGALTALSLLFGASFRKALGAAAGLAALLWVGFVYVLGLPLPLGTLWIR